MATSESNNASDLLQVQYIAQQPTTSSIGTSAEGICVINIPQNIIATHEDSEISGVEAESWTLSATEDRSEHEVVTSTRISPVRKFFHSCNQFSKSIYMAFVIPAVIVSLTIVIYYFEFYGK